MTNRFDYSSARWNRLSRSIRRLDDDRVEIKGIEYSLYHFGLLLIILQVLSFTAFHIYSISGERVVPSRPSSFSTLQEMVERRYIYITDLETWLIPFREEQVEDREYDIRRFADDPFYEPEPLEPYEEFYARYARIHGETSWERFWGTFRAWSLGPHIFGFILFGMAKLFMPMAAPIRLDARRRAVYGRGWYGYVLKRFFGLGDLRPNRKHEAPDTLEALKFRTKYDPEFAADWQNRRQTRLMRLFLPFKSPAMIHLRDEGCGTYQRFAMGAYPQRKNQPEELGQFIEDFFAHPDPGEWTKNLRYRWPIIGDLRGWIIGFNLYPCPHYNEAKTLKKIKKCFTFLDEARNIKR